MTKSTRYEALIACLSKAGSQQKLANGLGCSQAAIWKMLQSARQISVQYVLTAERLYGVSRHDLRPDIYPRPAPHDRQFDVDHYSGMTA